MDNNLENLKNGIEIPEILTGMIKVVGVGDRGVYTINYLRKTSCIGLGIAVFDASAGSSNSGLKSNKTQLNSGVNSSVLENCDLNGKKYYVGDNLHEIVDEKTKIIFIIAEHTDAKAIDIIAEFAKNKEVISLAIVIAAAEQGGVKTSKLVLCQNSLLPNPLDSLLVINTATLKKVYGNLSLEEQSLKINETIKEAIKNIIENVIVFSRVNIDDDKEPDFDDIRAVLCNSANVFVGSAKATGPNRAEAAVISALKGSLLLKSKIEGAQNILLAISSGKVEITIDEIGEINDYVQNETGHCSNIVMGVSEDLTLEDAIAVNILATGF
ncbi:hypothetical protein [Flavobacterium sp. GP15]|uniref:hypothetical protein n=1 Tax=Flavobacterium sp. GP15 TaxID=2758567 RepID=UPI00165E14E2|nr:hypothetical protein [Flavobacterium sp. GP15]